MDYLVPNYGMISAFAEIEGKKYYKYQGTHGRTWLVADVPNAGDYVYVSNSNNGPGEGFGWRKIKFPLIDGTEFELNGGWHSNSDSLFEDTGVDVRDRHLTFVVVAKERTRAEDSYSELLKDVLYIDPEPTIGKFSRGDELGQQWADKLGMKVAVYQKSQGGSWSGWKEPQGVVIENPA